MKYSSSTQQQQQQQQYRFLFFLLPIVIICSSKSKCTTTTLTTTTTATTKSSSSSSNRISVSSSTFHSFLSSPSSSKQPIRIIISTTIIMTLLLLLLQQAQQARATTTSSSSSSSSSRRQFIRRTTFMSSFVSLSTSVSSSPISSSSFLFQHHQQQQQQKFRRRQVGGLVSVSKPTSIAFLLHHHRPPPTTILRSSQLLVAFSTIANPIRDTIRTTATRTIATRTTARNIIRSTTRTSSSSSSRRYLSTEPPISFNEQQKSQSPNNPNNNPNNNNNNTNKDGPIIIDGKLTAATIRHELYERIKSYPTLYNNNHHHPVPGLAVILVGNRPDSVAYVTMKQKACTEIGIHSMKYTFTETVTTNELLQLVALLNNDTTIHGILIQLPLPKHIEQDIVLNSVHPSKDVDGLHPTNVAALQLYNNNNNNRHDGDYKKAPFHIACTPLACIELLDRYQIPIAGKHCIVIGRSHLVGLPLVRLLLGRNATVTCVHSQTIQPEHIVQQGSIIIAAVGKPYLVQSSWIQQNAVVIDVGINSIPNPNYEQQLSVYNEQLGLEKQQSSQSTSKKIIKKPKPTILVGDVNYNDVATKCSYITPVPGGVGPMTIAMLLHNTVQSFERSQQKQKE